MKVLTRNTAQETSDDALEWLVLLQSPSLTEQLEKDFFTWLNESPEHQKEFIAAEALWQRGGALSKTSRERNKQKSRDQSSWFGGYAGWGLGGLAGVCAVFLVFVFIGLDSEALDQNYKTAFGEQKVIELAEGSIVTLNSNSDLEVDLGSKGSRQLTLNNGEVFFDVAPNKERPFTVKTENGLIVVLGTQFSVAKHHGVTQVTVIEGRVGLLPDEDTWSGQVSPVVLVANQQMELDAAASTPKTIDADRFLAWRRGQLHFEGEVLLDVVAALNHYYDRSIHLDSKALEAKRVVAVFPLTNDFDTNLNHLKQALRLESHTEADGQIVLSEKEN